MQLLPEVGIDYNVNASIYPLSFEEDAVIIELLFVQQHDMGLTSTVGSF